MQNLGSNKLNIISKVEVDTWMGFFKKTIIDLEICILNIKLIIDTDINFNPMFKEISSFCGHYISLSYFYSTIQLCKLFVNRNTEKQSFHKIFSKLETYKFDDNLKQLLKANNKVRDNTDLFTNKNEIVECIVKLRKRMEEKSDLIEKINTRRDNFYAHSDLNRNVVPPERLVELEELKNLSVEVYKSLNFYNTTFLFEETSASWSISTLIEIAKEWYDDREKEIRI